MEAQVSNLLPKNAEVVIIGGGVMGASTAYHLAAAGVEKVVLLERESHFGLGATGRCAGGVRYQFATEINILLSIASMQMIEQFEATTGQDPLYRPCGYLFVLTNEADLKKFEMNVQLQHSLGVQTDWLDGDMVRSRIPMMHFSDALGGTIFEKDGLADPNSIVMGYVNRARQLGAQLLTDVHVTGINSSKDKVSGVETTLGPIATPLVVNAAGPWAAQIGELVGIDIPITPLRRQMITTTPLPDLPDDFPFVIDFSQSLYFHREGEGLLTGMSNPDEKPGFDQSIDDAWELQAMEAAVQRMPMLENAGRMAGWAGLYEVTPDAHPIFGATDLSGFYLVGGFSGHGFMHGPISGLLMKEIILDGTSKTVDVSMLDIDRFKEGRLIHEYNVV
jgi:sarcosine oxidase subunit beta